MKNLQGLYKMQKILMDRIDYKGKDRFDKTILALLVEVGECANEWRGFKYWSQDQEPRYKKEHTNGVNGEQWTTNPLLEEYVDGLHFVLQLGIELEFEDVKPYSLMKTNISETFKMVYQCVLHASIHRDKGSFEMLLSEYISLGYHLGFTDDEISLAYIAKNEVNHDRQNTGY